MVGVPVSEVASILGVTPRRVRALITTGRLDARRVGPMWVVTAESLAIQRAQVAAGATSRPMTPGTAWAAAAIADGGAAPWLDTTPRARVQTRLGGAPSSPEVWVRWLDRRAIRTERFEIAAAAIEEVLAEPTVVGSGVSPSATGHHHVGLGTGSDADVYVHVSDLDGLTTKYFLIPSPAGNFRIHTVDHAHAHATAVRTNQGLVAPRLIAAVDLMTTPDSRARAAGRRLLATVTT